MLSYLIIFILNLKNLYLCNCFRLLPCLLCLFFLFWKWLILREGTVFVRGKCGEDYALSFKWWMLPGKASFFFFGTCNSEVVARFVGNILGLNSYSIECAQSLLLSPGTARTMAHSWIHARVQLLLCFFFHFWIMVVESEHNSFFLNESHTMHKSIFLNAQ